MRSGRPEPVTASRKMARLFLPPAALEARRWLLARRDGVGQDQHALIPADWDAYAGVRGEGASRAQLRLAGSAPGDGRGRRDGDPRRVASRADLPRPRAILFLTYLMKAKFGKPVVLANHTSGLDGDLRSVADHVYPLIDDIVYRDPISAERWAPVYGGRFAGDSAFLFEPAERKAWSELTRRATYFDVWPDTATFDPAAPYICVGGSSIFHDRKDWTSLARGLHATCVREPPGGVLGDDRPDGVGRAGRARVPELAARLDLPLVGVRTPIQQAVDIVGNADAYVGGRWHPAIFARAGRRPAGPPLQPDGQDEGPGRRWPAPRSRSTRWIWSGLRRRSHGELSAVVERGDAARAELQGDRRRPRQEQLGQRLLSEPPHRRTRRRRGARTRSG